MIHCARCGHEFAGILGVLCEECRELAGKNAELQAFPEEPRVTGPRLLPPETEDEDAEG